MPFTPPGAFPVEFLDDGRVRTLEPFRWTGKYGDDVEVAAGTVSDGATRPWFTAAIVDQWGRASRAFLIHDVLCERLRTYQEARDAWWAVERVNRVVERAGHGLITVAPPPGRPAFDAVDTDGALRAILRELGTPAPLRWIYWTGVRWGALGSRYRWAGWWRTLPLLLALSPVTLAVMLPAVAGALVSRLLLALAEVVCWPVTRRRPRSLARRARRLEFPMRRRLQQDLQAAVLDAVDEAVLGTPEQRANPQPLHGLFHVPEPEHVNNPSRPLPEHDWKMPHHMGGLDAFAHEGIYPPPRPPMDAHGCPPNCPRRLEREARRLEDQAPPVAGA